MAFLNSPLEVWKVTKQKFTGLVDVSDSQVNRPARNNSARGNIRTQSNNVNLGRQITPTSDNLRHYSVGSKHAPKPIASQNEGVSHNPEDYKPMPQTRNQTASSANPNSYNKNSEVLLSPGALEAKISNISISKDSNFPSPTSSSAFQGKYGYRLQQNQGTTNFYSQDHSNKKKGARQRQKKSEEKQKTKKNKTEDDTIKPRQRFRSSSSDRATMRKDEAADFDHRRPTYHRSSSSVESSAGDDSDEDWSEQAEKVKMKIMSMWNNVKYGWTVKTTKTQFSLQKAIWFLGKCYHHRPEDPDIDRLHPGLNNVRSPAMELFKQDFFSRIWMTYRREFQQLAGSSLTTDCGWGCMLRSGQMLLAQSLIMHFIGRDWTLYKAQSAEEDRFHRLILQWFGDQMSDMSPFSVHQLVKIGKGSGKRAGDWYGPASVAHIIKEAVDQAPNVNPLLEQICVYVSQDCTIYKQDVIDLCTRRKSFSLMPVLHDVPEKPKIHRYEWTQQGASSDVNTSPEKTGPSHQYATSANKTPSSQQGSDSQQCNNLAMSQKTGVNSGPEEKTMNSQNLQDKKDFEKNLPSSAKPDQKCAISSGPTNIVSETGRRSYSNNENGILLSPSKDAETRLRSSSLENGASCPSSIGTSDSGTQGTIPDASSSSISQNGFSEALDAKGQFHSIDVPTGQPVSNGTSSGMPLAGAEETDGAQASKGAEENCKEMSSSSEDEERWCSVLIMIPVRLGGEEINSIYMRPIQSLFSMPSCVGIIGGKPKHSLYFVGFQEEKLIHLDPHYCQPVVDVSKPKFDVWSFHCMSPRKMSISKMDPSCTIGFYLRSRREFEKFCEEVPQVVTPPGSNTDYPMFIVRDGRCSEWNYQNSNSNKTERYLRVRHVNQEGKLVAPLRASEDFVLLD